MLNLLTRENADPKGGEPGQAQKSERGRGVGNVPITLCGGALKGPISGGELNRGEKRPSHAGASRKSFRGPHQKIQERAGIVRNLGAGGELEENQSALKAPMTRSLAKERRAFVQGSVMRRREGGQDRPTRRRIL